MVGRINACLDELKIHEEWRDTFKGDVISFIDANVAPEDFTSVQPNKLFSLAEKFIKSHRGQEYFPKYPSVSAHGAADFEKRVKTLTSCLHALRSNKRRDLAKKILHHSVSTTRTNRSVEAGPSETFSDKVGAKNEKSNLTNPASGIDGNEQILLNENTSTTMNLITDDPPPCTGAEIIDVSPSSVSDSHRGDEDYREDSCVPTNPVNEPQASMNARLPSKPTSSRWDQSTSVVRDRLSREMNLLPPSMGSDVTASAPTKRHHKQADLEHSEPISNKRVCTGSTRSVMQRQSSVDNRASQNPQHHTNEAVSLSLASQIPTQIATRSASPKQSDKAVNTVPLSLHTLTVGVMSLTVQTEVLIELPEIFLNYMRQVEDQYLAIEAACESSSSRQQVYRCRTELMSKLQYDLVIITENAVKKARDPQGTPRIGGYCLRS